MLVCKSEFLEDWGETFWQQNKNEILAFPKLPQNLQVLMEKVSFFEGVYLSFYVAHTSNKTKLPGIQKY